MAKIADDFEEYLRSEDGKSAPSWQIRVLREMRRGDSNPWSMQKYAEIRATLNEIDPLKRVKRAN
jgi:hypothetical protein